MADRDCGCMDSERRWMLAEGVVGVSKGTLVLFLWMVAAVVAGLWVANKVGVHA